MKNKITLPHDRYGKRLIFLVEERPNPSTDYFVLPAVSSIGAHLVRCGFADIPAAADIQNAVVVFVRYVPKSWVKLIEANRPNLAALVFFMDDDVLDTDASTGMPWRYRFKLAHLAAWRSSWLRQQDAELWVSTPYLQKKYVAWQPKLVLPSPVEFPSNVCRVFYHGSASHNAEIRWLLPVVEQALRSEERMAFEIVGGLDVYRLYRGLPRVTVVHPMKWPAYQHFLAMGDRHIGLAPLLDLPFNQARSYTKFFDFTRCGAVGIYSPNNALAEVVEDGVDGLIVALDQEAWVTAILKLVQEESLRQTLQYNARQKSVALANKAQGSYFGLL
jgi:glycosyltransferase involved in cell wall biosynthesis